MKQTNKLSDLMKNLSNELVDTFTTIDTNRGGSERVAVVKPQRSWVVSVEVEREPDLAVCR